MSPREAAAAINAAFDNRHAVHSALSAPAAGSVRRGPTFSSDNTAEDYGAALLMQFSRPRSHVTLLAHPAASAAVVWNVHIAFVLGLGVLAARYVAESWKTDDALLRAARFEGAAAAAVRRLAAPGASTAWETRNAPTVQQALGLLAVSHRDLCRTVESEQAAWLGFVFEQTGGRITRLADDFGYPITHPPRLKPARAKQAPSLSRSL